MRLSYTMLSTYQKCHRRMWLQYVKKLVPPEKVNQRPFIVGICADWLFKKWVERGYPLGWMEEESRGIFEWFSTKRNIRYLDPADKEKLIFKLGKSVVALQEAVLESKFPDRSLELQKELEVEHGQFTLTGKMDIWFSKERAIYDLKITVSTKYLDSFQLRYFAWLMERKYGIPVESLMFLSPLMRPYLREVTWLPTDKVDFESLLFYTLGQISSGNWDITTKDCWSCPVASYCEEFAVQSESERTASGGFKVKIGEDDGGF
jgi:CRISPR/Cas system-associated exonuclease Cas4 (RecB family)